MTPDELDRLDKLSAIHILGHEENEFWQPTRDIEQAWLMLEKLPTMSFDLAFRKMDPTDPYIVSLYIAGTVAYVAKGKTPSLAITLACLKSVGVEV